MHRGCARFIWWWPRTRRLQHTHNNHMHIFSSFALSKVPVSVQPRTCSTQIPDWLNASHARIRIVLHSQLFDEPARELPTFNSLAIESVLHRISGLSNFFLYFNNDVLLANPTPLSAFMRAGRYFKFEDWSLEPSDAVPECRFAADAPWSTIMPHVRHCASKVAFFWDRVVAHKAWSVRLEYWYPHSLSLSLACLLSLSHTLACSQFLVCTLALHLHGPSSTLVILFEIVAFSCFLHLTCLSLSTLFRSCFSDFRYAHMPVRCWQRCVFLFASLFLAHFSLFFLLLVFVLSLLYFKQHLWERRVLFVRSFVQYSWLFHSLFLLSHHFATAFVCFPQSQKVEKRLLAFFRRTRSNRVRDALTDVSMHMQ